MTATVYLRTYRKLGNVQIRVEGTRGTVISGVGVYHYDFRALPPDCDVRSSVLKFSLKCFFENLIGKSTGEKEPERKGLFGWLAEALMPRPRLPGRNDFKSTVVQEIRKNPAAYTWEDVDSAREYKCRENILDAIVKPPVVAMVGFQECFLHLDAAQPRELKPAKRREEADGVRKAYVEQFLKNEIEYIHRLGKHREAVLDYFADSCMGRDFEEILSSHRLLATEIAAQLGPAAAESVEAALVGAEFPASQNSGALAVGDAPDLNVIYRIFGGDSGLLGLYEKMVPRCNSLIEQGGLSPLVYECMAEIIQKITNYAAFFKSLFRGTGDDLAKSIFSKMEKYNKNLDNLSNEAYLEYKMRELVGKTNEAEELLGRSGTLRGEITCPYKNGTVHMYFFGENMLFLGSRMQILEDIRYENIEFLLYDRTAGFFTRISSLRSELFQRIPGDDYWQLAIPVDNKEAMWEAYRLFCTLKYGLEFMILDINTKESLLLGQPDARCDITVTNTNNKKCKRKEANTKKNDRSNTDPSQGTPDEVYTVQISIPETNYEGTHSLTRREILPKVASLNRTKREQAAQPPCMKLRTLLEHLCPDKMAKISFSPSAEDKLAFSEKETLLQLLLANFRSKELSEGECTELSKELDGNTNLHNDKEESTMKAYHELIETPREAARIIRDASAAQTLLILAVFLRRHLYNFFSPDELGGFVSEGSAPDLLNQKHFRAVLEACRAAFPASEALARRVLGAVLGADLPAERAVKLLSGSDT